MFLHGDVMTCNAFRVAGPLWGESIDYRWIPLTMDSPHKGPVTQALMFSLVLALTNYWTNIRIICDLRHHGAHVTSLLFTTPMRYERDFQ